MSQPGSSVQTQTRLEPLDFISTTAHELKTPLALISGLASMLKHGDFGRLSKRQAKYLGKIEFSSDRLLKLVEGLLAINAAHAQKLNLNLEAVSVETCLKQVLAELEPELAQHHQQVVLKIARNLPNIYADKQSIYQVLFNLADNAIKYSPANSKIIITSRAKKGLLQIQVKDQGLGIKKPNPNLLFERFTAGPNANSNPTSSGLGLFIVKNLIELHGGTVSARNLAKGSSFQVNLPLTQQLRLF